jgi:hypothetical protein
VTALDQRKYRLAAALSTDAARTFGLWSVAAFAALALASIAVRAATGEYLEFAYWVIYLVPLIVTALAWAHLTKSYPLAVANGLTRKEFLTAYALFGAATVVATAALTNLGLAVIGLLSTFRGTDDQQGFYGTGLLESIVRPAVYFAVGAAAGAVVIRLGRRWLGALASAVLVSLVLYRMPGYMAARMAVDELPMKDGINIEIPTQVSLVPLDAVLAVLFALLAWTLLAKAPMLTRPA